MNRHLRILLIEDDEDDFVFIKDLLGEICFLTFHLDWMNTYDFGIEAICRAEHDVVLLDYRLGERNGLEILRQAIANGCSAPIIFLTASGDYRIDNDAMIAGAADYLTKGQISSDLLERSIRYSILRKRAELELKNYRDHLEELVNQRTEQLESVNHELRGVISELKQAEEAKSRLAAIVESSDDAIISKTLDGTILTWNRGAQKLYGYSAREVVGKSISLLLPDDRPDEISAILRKIERGENVEHYETVRRSKDGRNINVSLAVSPIFDTSGRPVCASTIARDITERKHVEEEKERLEAQLRQAQKLEAIGTLAGGIAHDFNNVLTPMLGYVEMALIDLPQDSPMRPGLEQILSAALRGRDLVKQILSFGRLGKEQQQIPVEIGAIVKEALKLLRASLPSSIEIRHHIENVVANADPTQIHQVLMNLCTNAAHAMDGSGILEVGLSRVDFNKSNLADRAIVDLKPGPHLELRVSDTGIGIDPSDLGRIFDPYFTTKEVGKGSGLGLSVVNAIVKRHDGAITVRSVPGKGTTFSIYIPEMEADASVVVEAGQELPTGTGRILLIDDEESVINMETAILVRLGYKGTPETDSLRALETFRSRPGEFDLVITDYTMPKLNGVDLAKQLRSIRPDIPIILCTGFSEKVTGETAVDLGLELVMKPFGLRQMAESIRKVLTGPRTEELGNQNLT